VGRLIYSVICSLDGYVADAEGNFDWSMPDAEVHAFVNAQEREIGTFLFGRRLYEVLVAWENPDLVAGADPVLREYAEVWRAAEKIVYSTTLLAVTSARTRLERSFDPEAVAALKAGAARDLSIGGPHLAAQALRAGLVDEVRLLLSPVLVGGGTAALPPGLRLGLELLEAQRFAGGVVFLRYRTAAAS
jgi:dihydrofolate reductase